MDTLTRSALLTALDDLARGGGTLPREECSGLQERFPYDPAVRWGLQRLGGPRPPAPPGCLEASTALLGWLPTGWDEQALLQGLKLWAPYRSGPWRGLLQVGPQGELQTHLLGEPQAPGVRGHLHTFWEGSPVLGLTLDEVGRTWLYSWSEGRFWGLEREGARWRRVEGVPVPVGTGAQHVWVDASGDLHCLKDLSASPHFEPGDPLSEEFLEGAREFAQAQARLSRPQLWGACEFHSELWTFGDWRVFGVPQLVVDRRLLPLAGLRYFRVACGAAWGDLLALWVEAVSCPEGETLIVLTRNPPVAMLNP